MSKFRDTFSIGSRKIGKGQPCFIIAEAGVSHFGSIDKAMQLVDSAVSAGADAVKFQLFHTSALISSFDREWTGRMEPKEISVEAFCKIKDYAERSEIIFFATAHDFESLHELSSLDLPACKIGSGEVKNPEFFSAVARLGKPVIFSTGMYTAEDLQQSLNALEKEGCRRAAVMHCVTSYPTPENLVNLNKIKALKQIFPGPVGYSDHCASHDIAAASIVLGADLIEKHITLEKNIPNAQDWKVACDPEELKEFVKSVRRIEAALGNAEFLPVEEELRNLSWARKSIVAAKSLPAGTVLNSSDLLCKRPGMGISPDRIREIVGKTLLSDIAKDELITFEMLGEANISEHK